VEEKQQTVAAPPTLPGSRFAVLASAAEIGLYIGNLRVAFNPAGDVVAQQVEYSHGFSLSPIAAKQLAQILTNTTAEYEKRFGAIPVDPQSDAAAAPQEIK
jgi:hypothetical protein